MFNWEFIWKFRAIKQNLKIKFIKYKIQINKGKIKWKEVLNEIYRNFKEQVSDV